MQEKISNQKFHVLDKLAESIYLVNGNFIKFFSDLNIVNSRVKRTEYLNSTTPKIISSKGNFYMYKYVKGNLFSEISNRNNSLNFIKWAEKPMEKVKNYDADKFKNDCRSFYYDKTLARINDFYEKNIMDTPNIINGESISSLKDLVKVNFDELILDTPTNFHGDFILDNIIQVSENDFKLIDWRQDFAGNIDGGDKYYDLAKLAHNLVVNHEIIDNDLFEINIENSNIITININRFQTLVDSENLYFEYLKSKDYNIKKIKLLRRLFGLICHHFIITLLTFFLLLWQV